MKQKVYGLIGDPVSHSLSPQMQNTAFKTKKLPHTYHLFHVKKQNLKKAIEGAKALNLGGLNVTIPHKQKALKLCTETSEEAVIAGAVNTIDLKEKIHGYNTDIIGAKKAVTQPKKHYEKAVIVGAGGAARGVCIALKDNAKQITIINRTPKKARELSELLQKQNTKSSYRPLNKLSQELSNADLLINSTPVGMYPNTNKSITTKENLHKDLIVFDLVYRPIKTKLLKQAEEVGAKTINGVEMLVQQGAESFKIWTNREPPTDKMREAVHRELKQ
ncbi:Shikimate 5-dehydrogenase AroE [Methanonatronarchaeum thermophilum]|uniref:Shikimate dehydrogenase (NADP(+)) n=1 Tax=Methanonatronarchaeum thermophilum TaxID=1927129 RepID=A0A1Y3GDQ2_9EURY|nr:shikimate dehydrogenase [Methanonatronarchaeum thermophilum]OUJ18334.1 Shikimate 5-dehydrogenase AroE [Methanonatronarchaeum thermophilum]